MNENVSPEVRKLLGVENGGLKYPTYVEAPSFKPGTSEFDDQTSMRRRARFIASGEMLFKTDLSTLDDVGASALYEVVTDGMFGLKDSDGSLAFGKRASKDPHQNLELLRRFVKGEYNLIEDPEYTKWREMDEEGKFRYALEKEPKTNKVKSYLKGERGAGPVEQLAGGLSISMPGMPAGTAALFTPSHIRKQNEAVYNESVRRSNYDALNDEEKAAYRADVIGDYEKKLSRRQTLATYLQFASNLSDKAAYYLAESYQNGSPDINVEFLDPEERDRVYSAFSLMRGDQKRGRILGFETDFTDDTAMNRFQLGLYGLQQSVVGLVSDTGDMVRDAAIWTYAKTTMGDAERKAFFDAWDANVRAERAMEQPLPEAEGWFAAGYQGLMENVHWFIPYGAIGKGGKMAATAGKTAARAGLMKEAVTGMRTASELKAAAAKTRWLADVQSAVKAGKGAKKVSQFQSAIAMKRELAAVENYTKALSQIANVEKTAKAGQIGGRALWTVGEASALSAFTSDYIAAADAAGVSREESMMSAFAIGLVNARIERLYVAGLESSLTPAQVKALTFKALYNAVKSDGSAGFRKWFANRVQRGVVEGAKVTATEGLVEEPLQQLATEHGIAFDKLCQEMRADGQADLADKFAAFWQSFAKQLPEDYAIFVDTVFDTMPTSVAFGVTTVGNMTRRQHLHNVLTRHAARRAGSTSTMLSAKSGADLANAVDYDVGIVDMIQQGINTRTAVEKYWQDSDGEGDAKNANPNRFVEAITAARRAYRNPETRDAVGEIAQAAGVDVKTAEVIAQYLQTEAEATAFSPQARAFTSLNMSLADIDEETIKTVLPGYVEGSFAADTEAGIYSGRVKLGDGSERTIAYRVGDLSAELAEMANANAALDSNFGKSFDARHAQLGDGVTWQSLSDGQRYMEALRSAASVNGFSSGRSGIFELTDAKGEKVRVNADDVIYLANGRLGDIGYGPAATMGTARHETWHSLWRFARGTMDEADVQTLAKALGVDVAKEGWEIDLDEAMAHQLEAYASGHYVSHAVSSRFDKMLDGWAGNVIKFFGSFGPADEVKDPRTGQPFALKNFYDKVLKGELGSGNLGVELRSVPAAQQPGALADVAAGTMPVEVTDEERAAEDAELRTQAAKTETPLPESETKTPETGTKTPKTETQADKVEYTAENPADASVPNAQYYRIGLPNSEVKLVGRLEVRDARTGVTTSTDENYRDRGNQNRDDKSEESRGLVMKIAGRPDPLQVGTVQPIANNGIVWVLPNGDVIIGNHRVNGVRAGYEKGTAGDLEKFVREDAAKRGIEIGANVNAPLTVFVLERIESPDGKADVHEVVRLANESQNRGFNIREQAGNDAKILIDNNLLSRMAFRADGRIDETKSADAIGKFRQESGAQGLVAEDGMLTEEGQTRIQNAALAALLGGTGNAALMQRIMERSGLLDMASQMRALMKMTPELMALAETKPDFDLRPAIGEALELFTEWRETDEEKRVEKGKSRHDWRERGKNGERIRGLSWEAFMSQGDMFRKPSDEAQILGDLFARSEDLRSFDREDVESAAGKKRVVDLVSGYLADYIANARAVNTETDDMFGAPLASRADVLAAQRARGENGARFSMAAPVERSKNLIAVHNLKPSDLAAAAELEGMPAPSIAVVKDSMGHDNYGPISLVFRSDAIDPKGGRNNKIYSSDAWTPTRGSVNIEYKVLDEKLDEIIASLINAGDENYRKLFKAFSERGSLGDTAENAIAAGEYYRLWHNDAILLSYLHSKGQSVPLSFREQAISHNYSNAVVKGVSDAVGDKIAEIWENGGKTGDEEAVERMSEIMRPAAVKAKDDENPEGAAERRAKGVPTLGERLYGAALKRPWDLAKAVMQYREHGITEEIDTFAVSKTMSEMLSTDDPAYREWVRKTFAPAVGAKGIRNKLDVFTPRGNRRSWEALHDEVTAQRIVDMMYHNSKEVGGNGFGGYNPEGAAVRQYASIAEMRRDRDRLQAMPEEEWNKLRDETRKDFIDAVSSLQSKQKHFYSNNVFVELDSIQDIVLQAWIAAKGDKEKYLANCKDELHVYDESDCSDIWDVMMRLRNAPTKYFEAKPERVVGFDEVAFAVIPDDSSAETLEILKTHAIQTHTYKAEDKEDRLRVLNKAADENDTRFSIGGVYTGSAADYEKPSLHYVGKSNGVAFGWGLYGSSAKSDAINFGDNVYEQTYFINRAPGDESHLIEWDKSLTDENQERILDGLTHMARRNANVKNAVESVLAEEDRDFGRDQDEDYEPQEVEGMADDILREAIERTIDVRSDTGKSVYIHLAALLTGKTLGEVNSFAGRVDAFKAASEFLRDECDIDGIKYPAEADGAKHGETHYVSFRDDNIRVDHKWVDGEQRFSIATLGKYRTDDLRSLAHRVKDGDAEAIAEAGKRLAVIMPPDAVLVPMPSHTGEPTTMRLLADAIAANANGAKVVDALRSNAHESNYAQKKRGEEPAEIEMRKVADIPENAEVYIVDNVIDTGATYSAAMKAIPNAHILALADTDRTPSAELLQTMVEKALKSQYGVGSAARNGEGFVDLERGDTFKGIEKAVREKVHEQVENTHLGITATIGSNTNADHLVQKMSFFKDEDPEAHKYAVKNTLELFKKAKTAVVHHDKKGTKNDYIRAFTPFYFRDGIYLATITLRRDKDSDKFYSIEAVETERDAAPGVHNDASKMDSGDSPRSSRRTAQEAQSPESLKTGDSPRSSRRTAQEAQSPVSLEDKISYYVGDVNATDPKFLNSDEEFSLQKLAKRIRADISAFSTPMFSVAPGADARASGLFPALQSMSDDELVTAAVAVRMALGETGKFSDRAVKVNTVNKLIRRLHPDYKTGDVGRESLRIITDARKFAKKIREDLDRGVSDSLVLEHLPQTAREQFGREMMDEARRGQRLGRFGQKVADRLEERQTRIVEDAVRVQSGIDVSLMENTYGINLSETLMRLAENPLTEKPPAGASAAVNGEALEDEESAVAEESSAVDVGEAVKKAVADVVAASGVATDANERNRADRRAAAGRDKEREAELGAEDEAGAEGGAGDDFGGDIVAVATRKAGLDLENPRHLAEFVAELTRRYWIKEHELALDAEVWRDLVALQFLRKTAQGVYAKLCKDLTYSRSRETAIQHIAKLDNVPTVQGLLSEMEFVGALINAQRIRDTQKAMCEKLDLFLRQKFGAQGRFKPDKEEGKRNVSAEAELRARYMRHAMWLTPDAAAEEARTLQETLDALSVDFKDAGRDVDQSREFIETIRKLNVLREFGALRYKSVGEIEAAAKWWEDFERGESDDIMREMSDRDIRTKKAAHLLAVAFADPARKVMRGEGKLEKLNEYITGHMGFVALLNDCMRHASDADRAAVKDIVGYIAREIQKSGDGTASEKRRNNDAFHAAVEAIYGRKFNSVMTDMMAVDERFLEFMGETGGVKVPPTKARAMQLLVSLLQEGRKVEVEDEENPGKTKIVWEGGYHDNIVLHKREGQAEKIMKLLTPADLNMVKWLGMWYEQNRQDLSTVCHKLFGIGVYAELPNYFPVKMLLEKQGLEKGEAVGWTIFPKALTPRVRNERDFDTSADIFQMWASRMEEGVQWKHHAQLGLEMRGIFGRSELQAAVIAHHGAQANALMQGFITDILAGQGTVDRSMAGTQYFSDKVRGWTALCALGGNVGVMLKQTTSIPAFGFEIGLVNTARHFVSAFTPEGIQAMAAIWNSEQRKTRWDIGNSEAVANALRKQDAGWLKRAFQAAMITNKLGDAVPGLVIGQGIYRDCLERGMSAADAMAETWMIIERTQQSSRMENLASMQRRSRLGRTMFQFLSTQRQYLDYEMRAIRDVIANPKSAGRWGNLGRTLLLNHFILTTLYYWMGQLYKAMLGQEPPEDELTDWVITCLLGPFGSMFVAGFCCKYTLERALKGYSYGGGSSMLPMESWLTNQVNDAGRLVEAIFSNEGDSWDNMLDAAGKWMSDFNSTFRDLRKIYRFRIQEEPQKKK